MTFSWTNINNGDVGSSTRTKLNSLGTYVTNLNAQVIQFTNVAVPVSSWASNSTYTNYPYRAAIGASQVMSGVLATDIPFVTFSASDQESGIFTGADSAANIIYIYASQIPTAQLTLPVVFVLRVVSA